MENALTTTQNASMMLFAPQPGTTATDIRRAIAKQPEIMQSLTPVERSVFLASTERIAEEYTDAELAMKMADTLKWVARDIGYRGIDTPDWKITIVRISQIFKRHYATFSVNDIHIAFELLITGDLNDYLPKDRNGNPDKEHYQMFNADYFCKVLNAYKEYRKAVINKAAEMVPKPVQEQANNEYYMNNAKRKLIAAFYTFKYRGIMPNLSPIMEMLAYDILANTGLAEYFDVTERERQSALNRTLAQLTQQMLTHDYKTISAKGTKAPEIQTDAYMIARKKALKRAFVEMANEEIQITDYIKIA